MKYVPHERLALIEAKFVVLFFENQWSQWKFFHKCALLLHWWPVIAKTINRATPGFWHIPSHFKENARLRKVSTDDPRKLKLERQQRARVKRKTPAKPQPPKPIEPENLFDYADTKAKAEKEATTKEPSKG